MGRVETGYSKEGVIRNDHDTHAQKEVTTCGEVLARQGGVGEHTHEDHPMKTGETPPPVRCDVTKTKTYKKAGRYRSGGSNKCNRGIQKLAYGK